MISITKITRETDWGPYTGYICDTIQYNGDDRRSGSSRGRGSSAELGNVIEQKKIAR
jgi:hypothetical protein